MQGRKLHARMDVVLAVDRQHAKRPRLCRQAACKVESIVKLRLALAEQWPAMLPGQQQCQDSDRPSLPDARRRQMRVHL
jgi:hypothetical protein